MRPQVEYGCDLDGGRDLDGDLSCAFMHDHSLSSPFIRLF